MTASVPRDDRPPTRSLAGLLVDDRSGLALRGAARTARGLHGCRRGNVAILVLIMGLVFYAVSAMVWNTGKVTSAKIEAQTAADAAAYSSAVWTSRAMNVTTATNMLILRHSTALTAAFSPLPVILHPLFYWLRVSQWCSPLTFPPAIAACYGFWTSYYFGWEFPNYVYWLFTWGQGFIRVPEIIMNLAALWDYQRSWVDVYCPQKIEEQRKLLEAYYDCDIEIRGWRPTGPFSAPVPTDSIRPPLVRGNPITFMFPYMARAYQESWADADSWKNSIPMTVGMFIGRAPLLYKIGFISSFLINWLATGFFHHVPASQPVVSPIEVGPTLRELVDADAWKPFTVVATARKRSDNTTSRQPPRQPLTFMAPGLFGDPVAPVAYAQAETFHGIDAWAYPAGRFLYLPFRVWTTWGWQWQPRLSHGDPTHFALPGRAADSLVPEAVGSGLFSDLGVNVAPGDARRLSTH